MVMLHPRSDLGDTTLECYNCGNKNVFLLGFISAKAETVVVILCRHPCASTPSSKDMNWDTSGWLPLIEDRSFLPWLVSVPSEKEVLKSRHISPAQMARLEDLWKDNPNSKLSDLEKPNEVEIEPVLLRYDDAFQYQRCFGPLVLVEAEYDRKLKESQAQDDISVTWDLGLSKRHLVSFFLSKFEVADMKISVGDELRIKYIGGDNLKNPWNCSGYVIKIPDGTSEEVTVELRNYPSPPPTHATTGFSVEFVWSNTTYNRIQEALAKFAKEETSVSGFIYHKLLGHEIEQVSFKNTLPIVFSVPGLTELNIPQINAVKSVLQKPLSLIQGPPVLARLLYQPQLSII